MHKKLEETELLLKVTWPLFFAVSKILQMCLCFYSGFCEYWKTT